MAPPFTFSFSSGISSCRCTYTLWLANASFSSITSMSAIRSPVFWSSFFTAGMARCP